ncbi:MAG TPA: hypothetical protein EYP07_16875 [Kiloniellaceae bacterium]|nr:hypothetical protein [Kiloniellaceae bacterium]
MTHQSQAENTSSPAPEDWKIDRMSAGLDHAFDRARIERHIAEGRRMQAEAIAAALKALFARLWPAKRPTAKAGAVTQSAPGQAVQA